MHDRSREKNDTCKVARKCNTHVYRVTATHLFSADPGSPPPPPPQDTLRVNRDKNLACVSYVILLVEFVYAELLGFQEVEQGWAGDEPGARPQRAQRARARAHACKTKDGYNRRKLTNTAHVTYTNTRVVN